MLPLLAKPPKLAENLASLLGNGSYMGYENIIRMKE